MVALIPFCFRRAADAGRARIGAPGTIQNDILKEYGAARLRIRSSRRCA
jgi:hypothetical protein